MLVKLKIAMRAFRDLLCATGAVALGAFFAVERSWMWLLPMCLLVAAIAACFYKIEERRAARRDRRMGDLASAKRRAESAIAKPRAAESAAARAARPEPPKTAKFTWTLTENGVPVGVEYDRRARG